MTKHQTTSRLQTSQHQPLPATLILETVRTKALVRHVLIVLLYAPIALFLLWPVIPQLSSSIVGGPIAAIDGWQGVWSMWWVRHALLHGTNPFITDLLFYPTGASLYIQPLNTTNALLTWPVQAAFGPIVAFNVAVFLAFVLTGYTTYLLARSFDMQRIPAFLAGALFTYAPFHITKVSDGQLEWIALQWIPLYVLAVQRVLTRVQRRWAVAAAGCFVLVTLTNWYLGCFVAVWTCVIAVLTLRRLGREYPWSYLMQLAALFIAITAACLGPLVFAGLALQEPQTSLPEQVYTRSADLLDLVMPSQWHPLVGSAVNAWSQQIRPHITGWNITPTISVLVLAFVGARMLGRRAIPLIATVVVFTLLALGPSLRVAGQDTGIPLLYRLVSEVPGMTLARRPNHFFVLALLALVILAGFGLQALWQRRNAGRWLAGAAVALACAEYAVVPMQSIPLATDQGYARLASLPGAIIDVPVAIDSPTTMKAQLLHQRPIVDGYLAHTPSTVVASQIPGLRDFWNLKHKDDIISSPQQELNAFSYYDLRTLVIRNGSLSAEQEAEVQASIERLMPGARPVYQTTGIRVYDLPSLHNTPHTFGFVGNDWNAPEQEGDQIFRWMSKNGSINIINPGTTAKATQLHMTLQSYQQSRALAIAVDGQLLTELSVPTAPTEFSISVMLEPGEHRLDLSSATAPAADGRQLSIQARNIVISEE